MDNAAKRVVAKKEIPGYEPEGVAARLARDAVYCTTEDREGYLAWNYVGKTNRQPPRVLEIQERWGLPTWSEEYVEFKAKTNLDFTTKLRLGLLFPHNWTKDRDYKAMICPLCKDEIYVNHSVICNGTTIGSTFQEALHKGMQGRTKATREHEMQYCRHATGAIAEHLSRGAYLPKAKQIWSKTQWTEGWKKLIPVWRARHTLYLEEYYKEGSGQVQRCPAKRTTLTNTTKRAVWPEDIYTNLQRGIRHLKQTNTETALKERTIRQIAGAIYKHMLAEAEEQEL